MANFDLYTFLIINPHRNRIHEFRIFRGLFILTICIFRNRMIILVLMMNRKRNLLCYELTYLKFDFCGVNYTVLLLLCFFNIKLYSIISKSNRSFDFFHSHIFGFFLKPYLVIDPESYFSYNMKKNLSKEAQIEIAKLIAKGRHGNIYQNFGLTKKNVNFAVTFFLLF